jgi:hypothetical protein
VKIENTCDHVMMDSIGNKENCSKEDFKKEI